MTTTVELPHPSGRLSTNDESLTLPGAPGHRIRGLWGALTAQERHALKPHLIGTTSAEWLADILTSQGHPIGATTIKVYRRSLRQNGTAQ